ncbi:MAG: glycine--tRNA ligase [Planctomycetota bacterium]
MSPTPTDPATKSMDDLVALCKRRGFVYPASEIYGGLNGFWDYGPLGTALKNHLRDHWWHCMVAAPPLAPANVSGYEQGEPVSIVGLDSSIIQNPKTWEASGHVGGFNDPMMDDTETKQRFRSDHLFVFYVVRCTEPYMEIKRGGLVEGLKKGFLPPSFSVIASTDGEALDEALKNKKLKKAFNFTGGGGKVTAGGNVLYLTGHTADNEQFFAFPFELEQSQLQEHHAEIPSPFTGKTGSLTPPREFNLMFDTTVGAIKSDDNKAYLRPETAQGIFLNFKNVVDTMRVKVPFGIAQIGKSFRNEVTPRNFIFRSREFEQMEMEWFCPPDESQQWYQFWREQRFNWWLGLGINPDHLILRDHDEDELSHYSNATVDVEYKYPFTAPGYGELEGVAHRGCFDLTQHKEHSGKDLSYFDQELQVRLQNEGVDKAEIKERSRYIPHVIEPASGLTRAVLVMLCEAYTPDESRPSKVFMKFPPKFAPIKAGVFPLVNKDGMPEIARKLYMQLREKYAVEYDAKQSIGKRYARMDEIGTPFCFTIDSDTLSDQTVTVRDRDTQEQSRINLDQVETFLAEHLG